MYVDRQKVNIQSHKMEKWERNKEHFETMIIEKGRHFANKEVRRWVKQKEIKHVRTLLYDHRGAKLLKGA